MENEKLSPVEEAMSALISELDEETLNKAVGGMSQTHKKALIGAGLIIAAAGAGAGCYWWKRKGGDVSDGQCPTLSGISDVYGINEQEAENLMKYLKTQNQTFINEGGKFKILGSNGKVVGDMTEDFVKAHIK